MIRKHIFQKVFLLISIFMFSLQSYGMIDDKLNEAIKSGKLDVVRQFLANDTTLNAIDPSTGMTLLMLAANSGQEKVVHLLIDKGADVNAATILGETDLIFAIEKDREKIVRILIDRGADVNWKNRC